MFNNIDVLYLKNEQDIELLSLHTQSISKQKILGLNTTIYLNFLGFIIFKVYRYRRTFEHNVSFIKKNIFYPLYRKLYITIHKCWTDRHNFLEMLRIFSLHYMYNEQLFRWYFCLSGEKHPWAWFCYVNGN